MPGDPKAATLGRILFVSAPILIGVVLTVMPLWQTLIAAEQTERKALLMELDPLYCDVIVKRWEEFTGRKAEREKAPATAEA